MAQKNFSIGLDVKEDFERFCTENAYTEGAVMAAAFLAFSTIDHADRVKWFTKANAKWGQAPVKNMGGQSIGPQRGSGRAKDAG